MCFGLEYDSAKFETAVRVSQLHKDMENFVRGEDTVIGERGVNISGGQKARISLARAIYADADIYLLDDPLSAVDPEVASKIFSECIEGHLKDKIVVLVTHQLQFISNCKKILVLKDNKQEICAPYQAIQEQGMDLEAILKEYTTMMRKQSTLAPQKTFKSEA